jgi:hypothetical protein
MPGAMLFSSSASAVRVPEKDKHRDDEGLHSDDKMVTRNMIAFRDNQSTCSTDAGWQWIIRVELFGRLVVIPH